MTLKEEIQIVLNRYCAENRSNTPDFILADYLMDCLHAFDRAVVDRSVWYGRMDSPSLSDSAPKRQEKENG